MALCCVSCCSGHSSGVLFHSLLPISGALSLVRRISCIRTSQEWERKPWFQYRHASGLSKAAKRLEKLGLGPDGKPLPVANYKKIYPQMYKVLMVNQDGSTYTIRHRLKLLYRSAKQTEHLLQRIYYFLQQDKA